MKFLFRPDLNRRDLRDKLNALFLNSGALKCSTPGIQTE